MLWDAVGAAVGSIWAVLRPARFARGQVAGVPDPRARRRRIVAAMVVLITGLVALTLFRLVHRPASAPTQMLHGVYDVVPAELRKQLGKRGAIVLVETTGCESCTGSQALQELAAAIRRESGLKIAATEVVPMLDDRPLSLPADLYLRLVRTHPDVKAIVSLVGAPELDDKQVAELPPVRPKLVVMALMGTPVGLKQMVDSGLVDLAIVPRSETGNPQQELPQTAQGWFDDNYEVLNAPMK